MSKYKDYEQSVETAYWLLRNTTLTFHQIADFCDLNPLEIAHIENTSGKIKKTGYNPVFYQEITQDDVTRCEQDPAARLVKPEEVKLTKKSKISKQNDKIAAKAKKIEDNIVAKAEALQKKEEAAQLKRNNTKKTPAVKAVTAKKTVVRKVAVKTPAVKAVTAKKTTVKSKPALKTSKTKTSIRTK